MLRSYIAANEEKLFLKFTGTITTGIEAALTADSIGGQCEACGADLQETMDLDGNTTDTKRWIVCGACRTRYPIATLECEGHPAGPFDPMGQTVYCDGSCR